MAGLAAVAFVSSLSVEVGIGISVPSPGKSKLGSCTCRFVAAICFFNRLSSAAVGFLPDLNKVFSFEYSSCLSFAECFRAEFVSFVGFTAVDTRRTGGVPVFGVEPCGIRL